MQNHFITRCLTIYLEAVQLPLPLLLPPPALPLPPPPIPLLVPPPRLLSIAYTKYIKKSM